MTWRIRPWNCLILVGVLGFGCESKKAEAPTEAPSQPGDTEVKPDKPTEGGDIEVPDIKGPVAKVNGVEIPPGDFIEEYTSTLKRYQRSRHMVQPALRERLKDNIVRRLVDAELIRQQATKLGVTLDEAEFTKKWGEHKARFGSEEGFKSFLERSGTTEGTVEKQFRLNALREQVFAKLGESPEPDEKELKTFYEQNRSRYDVPEQVRASHILLRVAPNASEEEVSKVKATAEKILKDAKKKGADFAALAKEYGQDPTKDRGGDLGFFTKGRMVKPFEDAVWPLKDNQVAGPVRTNFGFHIIKKTGSMPAKTRGFDEVRAQIAASIKGKKQNEKIRDALQKWRDESAIEIFVKGDPEIMKASPVMPGGQPVVPASRPQGTLIQPAPRLVPQGTRNAKSNLRTTEMPAPSTADRPMGRPSPVMPKPTK